MDGKVFASLRSNRKHNRNKNAIVLQCTCAKMQEVFPGIPTHLRRESIHTPSEHIWWRPDSDVLLMACQQLNVPFLQEALPRQEENLFVMLCVYMKDRQFNITNILVRDTVSSFWNLVGAKLGLANGSVTGLEGMCQEL